MWGTLFKRVLKGHQGEIAHSGIPAFGDKPTLDYFWDPGVTPSSCQSEAIPDVIRTQRYLGVSSLPQSVAFDKSIDISCGLFRRFQSWD